MAPLSEVGVTAVPTPSMADDDVQDMTGWFGNAEKAWWHGTAIRLLKMGPIPSHVAFVMDGNRRFARNNQMGSVLRGHECGFQQLTKILEWCANLGVHEVTVYAFSIENFKRSEEEVGGLMRLAEEKFERLLQETDRLAEKRIRFRFLGDVSLLSPSLRAKVAKITLATEEYENGTVNVCMPYTSTDEMARAMEVIRLGREKGLIEDEEQITEWLLNQCLDSAPSEDVDLLVRTSGERRLSDFLLWQASSAHIHYESVMWPEFSFYHLCKAIGAYQYHHGGIQKVQATVRTSKPSIEEQDRLAAFFHWHRQRRRDQLLQWEDAPSE